MQRLHVLGTTKHFVDIRTSGMLLRRLKLRLLVRLEDAVAEDDVDGCRVRSFERKPDAGISEMGRRG